MTHTDYSAILATILLLAIPTALAVVVAAVFRIIGHVTHHRPETFVWDIKTRRWIPAQDKRERLS